MEMSPNLWTWDSGSTVGNSGKEGLRKQVQEDKGEF